MDIERNSLPEEQRPVVKLEEFVDEIKEEPKIITNIKKSINTATAIFQDEEEQPAKKEKGVGEAEWIRVVSLRRMRSRRKLQTKTIISEWKTSTNFGELVDLLQVVLSILAVITYVYDTYLPDEPTWLYRLDLSLATFFAFDYIQGLYLTKNKLKYIFSLYPLIDAITIIPVFAQSVTRLSFFRVARMMRILRLLKEYKIVNVVLTPVRRQIAVVCFTIFCLIFIAAGLINITEVDADGNEIPFHTCLYCIVVTISTVGYGDVTPKSELGRAIMMGLIVSGAILVPVQLNKLGDILAQYSPYDRDYNNRGRHVLLSGQLSPAILIDFLETYYYEDRGQMKSKVVILEPGKPSPDILAVAKMPQYAKKLVYLRGTPMLNNDLQRARADAASACFVFSNPYSQDHPLVDRETMLRTLSVRKFNPSLPVFCQLNGIAAKRQVAKIGVKQSFSVNELKLNLMAKSVLYPGLDTFICNLVTNNRYTRLNLLSAKSISWEEEYLHGRSHGIYAIKLPPAFTAKSFIDVVIDIYTRFSSILFAIQVGGEKGYISLNPGNKYTIEGGEVAFVISQSCEIARDIASYEESRRHASLQEVKMSNAIPLNPTTSNSYLGPSKSSGFYSSSKGYQEETTEQEYYITPHNSPTLEEVTLDSIRDLKSGISNHVLICGSSKDLEFLIRPLRSRLILAEKMQDIVVLHTEPPTDQEWENISQFTRLFYIRGSSLQWNDMVRAGIEHAHSIIILSNSTVKEKDEEFHIDSDAVLTWLILQANSPRKLNTIVEIVKDSNAKFLIHGKRSKIQIESNFIPAYAAGQIYYASLLNCLLSQAFFNPHIISIVSMWSSMTISMPGNQIQCSLIQMDVPPEYVGKTFYSLFFGMIQNNVLILSLYRINKDETTYVYTCPLPNSILYAGDKVFVLSAVSGTYTGFETVTL